MGADLSDLSPRGDEEYVDPFTTENRLGVVVETDRGDEYIFGNKYLDWLAVTLDALFWWWVLLPVFLIYYWLS
jgi:hypothetical protein|tara:strand:+ start:163 stop:381 length:219 start_codon:yes stop_codon:yes gene_type:complete